MDDLSAASQRDDHCAMLPPRLRGGAAQKVVKKLLDLGLVEAVRARGDLPVWRREDDGCAMALRLTSRGLERNSGRPWRVGAEPARPHFGARGWCEDGRESILLSPAELAGTSGFVAQVAHLFAKNVLCDTVHLDNILVLNNRVYKVVGSHVAIHPEAVKRRARMFCHGLSDRSFVRDTRWPHNEPPETPTRLREGDR